jgi:mRNA interferase MazF
MARRPKVVRPKRGKVYLVTFDPTMGAEIQKARPALIVQNDIANRHSPITIVAAITSQVDAPLYPTEVLIQPPEGGVTIPSVVLLNQIRSIDKRRLVRRLGMLTPAAMTRVDRAMLISLPDGLLGP